MVRLEKVCHNTLNNYLERGLGVTLYNTIKEAINLNILLVPPVLGKLKLKHKRVNMKFFTSFKIHNHVRSTDRMVVSRLLSYNLEVQKQNNNVTLQ